MTTAKDIRKTVTDINPVYAAVGATDLAVEKVRDARTRAAAIRFNLDISAMQDNAAKRFEKISLQAQQVPESVRDQTTEVAGKARETYAGLAVRGEKLVKRIRGQKSTQNLFDQAGNTVTLGKGAVTTVRKAAHDTQEAAKATLLTGRHEAESVFDAVVSSVHHESAATTEAVREAAATTRVAAEETVTTAKKSTASAQRATRSVAAGARKTATTASAAAKTATPKVGD